jgi:glycerol uptake facilitator-like aquaporin
LALVFVILTKRPTQQLAPVVAGALLTAFIVALAGMSGVGFNPYGL